MSNSEDRPSSKHMDHARAAEDQNYAASLQRLGDTASLVDDFLDTHIALGELLRRTKDPPGHLHVASLLFLSAMYEFHRACLDTLRGRLSDGVQCTRRAVEAAAFAARIARHPHLAEVWFRASESEEAYERYRRKFSGANLFPDDDELLVRLRSRYDHRSKQYHSSIHSVASRASLKLDEGKLDYRFAFTRSMTKTTLNPPVHFSTSSIPSSACCGYSSECSPSNWGKISKLGR